MTSQYHKPVLLQSSLEGLNIKPEGVYVDVTFGGGGHSRALLGRLNENGRLFGFDKDPDALLIRSQILNENDLSGFQSS